LDSKQEHRRQFLFIISQCFKYLLKTLIQLIQTSLSKNPL